MRGREMIRLRRLHSHLQVLPAGIVPLANRPLNFLALASIVLPHTISS